MPSRRYRSVNASLNTTFSAGISSTRATYGPSICAAWRHVRALTTSVLRAGAGEQLAAVHATRIALRHHRRAGLLVVPHADHAIQPFAHLLDVRDEDDLFEPVLQPAQQLHDVLS